MVVYTLGQLRVSSINVPEEPLPTPWPVRRQPKIASAWLIFSDKVVPYNSWRLLPAQLRILIVILFSSFKIEKLCGAIFFFRTWKYLLNAEHYNSGDCSVC